VTFMKPNPEGLNKIIHAKTSYVFIGDSITDFIAAKLCEIDYLEYHFNDEADI
jgi:2-hydroxy-3-keto-5-methylthiopentenyl-1-phosphate phosphatase